jgi:hypothetical protein
MREAQVEAILGPEKDSSSWIEPFWDPRLSGPPPERKAFVRRRWEAGRVTITVTFMETHAKEGGGVVDKNFDAAGGAP